MGTSEISTSENSTSENSTSENSTLEETLEYVVTSGCNITKELGKNTVREFELQLRESPNFLLLMNSKLKRSLKTELLEHTLLVTSTSPTETVCEWIAQHSSMKFICSYENSNEERELAYFIIRLCIDVRTIPSNFDFYYRSEYFWGIRRVRKILGILKDYEKWIKL